MRPRLTSARSRRFTLIAYQTGGASLEPKLLVDATFEPDLQPFESVGAEDRSREIWLAKVVSDCTSRITAESISPIHRGVVRANEALNARCDALAKDGRVCGTRTLAIHSDLRENANPVIASALAYPSKKNLKALEPLIIPIDPGVHVLVCGVSDSREAPLSATDANVAGTVWRILLGPAAPPSFDPTCPRGNAPTASREGRSL
jgi:hypothetical protein